MFQILNPRILYCEPYSLRRSEFPASLYFVNVRPRFLCVAMISVTNGNLMRCSPYCFTCLQDVSSARDGERLDHRLHVRQFGIHDCEFMVPQGELLLSRPSGLTLARSGMILTTSG